MNCDIFEHFYIFKDVYILLLKNNNFFISKIISLDIEFKNL